MSTTTSSSLKATLIVAQDTQRGIGSKGKLPWRLSKEMKYFANATTAAPSGKQNAVVMGRTTWEGIPKKFRPLKDRINVVLSSKSRDELQLPENVLKSTSLPDAISALSEDPEAREHLHRFFIIGGTQLYNASLKEEQIADRILLTQIEKGNNTWECDTFFPELDPQVWSKSSTQDHQEWLQGVDVPAGTIEENGVSWTYEMWTRK